MPELRQPGKERMSLDYDMEKTPAGWKVYDITVAGISLVTSYRDSFSEMIRDGGVDGLIKALEKKRTGRANPVPRLPRAECAGSAAKRRAKHRQRDEHQELTGC